MLQQQLINTNEYMIKKIKHPHISSQAIDPSNVIKKGNKASIQTIQTTRTNQNKIDPHRLQTEPHKMQITVPFQDEWEEIYNRRENYLNSMFNRRKTVLQNISKKNRDIYLRITNQQSHYHYPRHREDQSRPKNTLDTLTANSRLMLTLSKHAINQSNSQATRLEPLKEKQTNIKISEGQEDRLDKKMVSKQLTPIIEAATADFKIIQSRYLKDELSFNSSHKVVGMGKKRGCSVGRVRLADVFTNF